MSMESNPNEIVTLAHCPGCEMLSLAGDLNKCGHPSDDTGHHLECPRCSVRINAEHFYDFVDIRVVNYE